jgi:bacillopeptidase F (M6 metalloprotease family)
MGIQGALTQAQTNQIQAKIESMDKDSILAQMKLINDAVESGVIQDIKAAQAQYNALSAQLAKLEGQETKPAGQDANVIASYG